MKILITSFLLVYACQPAFTVEETPQANMGRLKINLISFNPLTTQIDTFFCDREPEAIRKKCERRPDCKFVVTSEILAAPHALGELPFEAVLHYQCVGRQPDRASSYVQQLTEGAEVTLKCPNQPSKWFKFPWQ